MSALSDLSPANWHARTTQAAEGLPRRRFTTKEIEAFVASGVLSENERFELIGGEIVPMSPKGIRHERLKTWLMIHFARRIPYDVLVTQETTFYLSDDTFIEPDFVFYDRVLGLEGLNGKTCLLAVEVSASSLGYDRGRKAHLYASFGVAELWVIDVETLSVRVHRAPGEDGYREIVERNVDDRLVPLHVPDVSLRLSDFERERP